MKSKLTIEVTEEELLKIKKARLAKEQQEKEDFESKATRVAELAEDVYEFSHDLISESVCNIEHGPEFESFTKSQFKVRAEKFCKELLGELLKANPIFSKGDIFYFFDNQSNPMVGEDETLDYCHTLYEVADCPFKFKNFKKL